MFVVKLFEWNLCFWLAALIFTQDEIQALPRVLSAPRFATYLDEKNGDSDKALTLYQWNLELSSAFIVTLHICEVSVRNSIVRAIEATYGPKWPWEKSFQISLKDSGKKYRPRQDILKLEGFPTSGKIVAELKFIFWQTMLARGHDAAIWNSYFRYAFPYAPRGKTIQTLRAEGYDNLNSIRLLRNRIAHHEPIFRRNIQQEYNRIRDMISWTDPIAAAWLDKIEKITYLLSVKL